MGVEPSFDILKPVIQFALDDPDMKTIPYAITFEDIYNAILEVENRF